METLYPDCKDRNSLGSGKGYEQFVSKVFKEKFGIPIDVYSSVKDQFNIGESRQGFEIKLDRRISGINGTGNLSIEVAEKSKASNSQFVPSGIFRDDNTWLYIQGNYDVIFVFVKKVLQELSRNYVIDTYPTIKRFLLPIVEAERYAMKLEC